MCHLWIIAYCYCDIVVVTLTAQHVFKVLNRCLFLTVIRSCTVRSMCDKKNSNNINIAIWMSYNWIRLAIEWWVSLKCANRLDWNWNWRCYKIDKINFCFFYLQLSLCIQRLKRSWKQLDLLSFRNNVND